MKYINYKLRFPEDKGVLYDSFQYPAGETQVRLKEKFGMLLTGGFIQNLQICAKISSAQDIIELMLLDSAIPYHKVISCDLVLPYMPYSRADRKFTEADCFGLKVFCDVLKNLNFWSAQSGGRILTLDAHSEVTKHQFLSLLENVSPVPLINGLIPEICSRSSGTFAILLPDAGAFKKYENTNFIGFRKFFATKKRDAATGKLSGFEIPDEVREFDNILIVDDICDGGGTFIGIAEQIPNSKLFLYVSHGIFSKGITDLRKHFRKIYTTNSFNQWYNKEFVTVYDAYEFLTNGVIQEATDE